MKEIKRLNSEINKNIAYLDAIQNNDHFTDSDRNTIVPRVALKTINAVDSLRAAIVNQIPVETTPLAQEHKNRVLRESNFPTHKGH